MGEWLPSTREPSWWSDWRSSPKQTTSVRLQPRAAYSRSPSRLPTMVKLHNKHTNLQRYGNFFSLRDIRMEHISWIDYQ